MTAERELYILFVINIPLDFTRKLIRGLYPQILIEADAKPRRRGAGDYGKSFGNTSRPLEGIVGKSRLTNRLKSVATTTTAERFSMGGEGVYRYKSV